MVFRERSGCAPTVAGSGARPDSERRRAFLISFIKPIFDPLNPIRHSPFLFSFAQTLFQPFSILHLIMTN